MTFYETIIKRRSIRRFKDMLVPYQILDKCVNAARLAPSAANLQPLVYIVVDGEQLLDIVFDTMKWANYTIALVVALGYPNESPIAEDFEALSNTGKTKATCSTYQNGTWGHFA